jgi:hypothetical protein
VGSPTRASRLGVWLLGAVTVVVVVASAMLTGSWVLYNARLFE